MSLQPKLNLKENCKFTKKDLHNLRIFYFNYEDRFDENSLYGFIQFDLIRFIKINPCPCFPLHCLLASNSSFFSILINLSSFFRSSHRRFTGKHLCWSLFVIELQVFMAATLLKERILRIFKNTYSEEQLRKVASDSYFVLSKYSILSLGSFKVQYS